MPPSPYPPKPTPKQAAKEALKRMSPASRTGVPQTTSTRGLPIQTKRIAWADREYGLGYDQSNGNFTGSNIATRPNFARTQISRNRPADSAFDEEWGSAGQANGTIYASTYSPQYDRRGSLDDVMRKRPGTKLERDNGVTDRYGQTSYLRSRNRGYEPPMRLLLNSNARSASRAASVAATRAANRQPAKGS